MHYIWMRYAECHCNMNHLAVSDEGRARPNETGVVAISAPVEGVATGSGDAASARERTRGCPDRATSRDDRAGHAARTATGGDHLKVNALSPKGSVHRCTKFFFLKHVVSTLVFSILFNHHLFPRKRSV